MTPPTPRPAIPFGAVFVLALSVATAVSGCRAGPTPPTGPRLVEIGLVETPVEGRSGPLFGDPPLLLWDTLEKLRSFAEDDDIRGVFLRAGPLSGAWARVGELRSALDAIREQGKPVHCHFETADNASYALLAAGCDRLTMTPAGDLSLVGVAAQVFYLAPLLDDLGVEAEILQVGDYKGGADPFTEREMPEPVRRNLGQLLDDQQRLLVEAVAAGRDLSPEQVRGLVDRGPFDAGWAVGAGLVDKATFADAARQALRDETGTSRLEQVELRPVPDEVGITDLLEALAGGREDARPTGERIAVVHVVGQIVDGDDRNVDGVASGPFVRALKRLRDDGDVRAVVLRIASPGGSALASDVMWHAARTLAEKKPVIASLGDLAASGGYYLAVAAGDVVADPGTVVGSIGVFGGKVVARDLAERWGVRIETLTRGDRAAWLSPFTPFDDADRRRLRRLLDTTYERFVDRVVAGRAELTDANVADAAQGRVFSGATAVENGLVDRLGGLRDAIALARERGGVADDRPIEHWPPARGLLDVLAGNLNAEARAMGGQLSPAAAARGMLDAAGLPAPELAQLVGALLGGGGAVLMPPFALRIE